MSNRRQKNEIESLKITIATLEQSRASMRDAIRELEATTASLQATIDSLEENLEIALDESEQRKQCPTIMMCFC